jgi:hypothetical protein
MGGGTAAVGGGSATVDDGGCPWGVVGAWCRCFGDAGRPASLVWSQCADGFTSTHAGLNALAPVIGSSNALSAGVFGNTITNTMHDAGSIAIVDGLDALGASDRGRLVGHLRIEFPPPGLTPGPTTFAMLTNATADVMLLSMAIHSDQHVGVDSSAGMIFNTGVNYWEQTGLAYGTTQLLDLRWQRGAFITLDIDGQRADTVQRNGGMPGGDGVPHSLFLGVVTADWTADSGYSGTWSDWLLFNDPDAGF